MIRTLLLAAFLGLVACSEEPALPPAAPLTASPQQVQSLYGAQAGDLPVRRVTDLALPATDTGRELPFSVYFPDGEGPYPLLLFSHGNWSNRHSYDRLIEHWVSHGYVVLAADHLDCCGAPWGILNSLRYGQLGLVLARVNDLQRLLGALPEIEALVPEFAGRTDPARVAVTGHSFGAFSAQQLGGAQAYDPDQNRFLGQRDPRVQAVVALSPPGPMFDIITGDSWRQLAAPTLVTTGTWDVQPRFWPDWRLHLMSFDTAQPGHQYALVTEGADHFLGNLICRPEREATPQEDALQMVLAATTAFLDHYLKQREGASALLHSERLAQVTADFSRLLRR
jgi:predicted dienelactone hydrolase